MCRRRSVCAIAVLLLALLLCSGCQLAAGIAELTRSPLPPQTPMPTHSQDTLNSVLDAQLGVLAAYISPSERTRAMGCLEKLRPLQTARLAEGRYAQSGAEKKLIKQLNQLYERYTIKYLGDGGAFGYSNPTERSLADYLIEDSGAQLAPDGRPPNAAEDQSYRALWTSMTALLPEGAFRDFTHFTVFSDGVGETLAYVVMTDDIGAKWAIAVDPADTADSGDFQETVLHEYTHYLTLNDAQAHYSDLQTTNTYNEAGMQTRTDSYLNAFYQDFWVDTLDDRRVNPDSYNFFLRHADDFVTEYASTDPSEDIAESFTYFVVYDRQEGNEVWVQKLNFFYQYPELSDFRTQIRALIGLDNPTPAFH